MNQNEIEYATAAEQAQAVRTKQLSASELLELTLRRIDRENPRLNAIVWQYRDEAAARANALDADLARGRSAGPLHGVPITIKEAFAYRGSPSSWGLPPLARATSPRTAVAIARLESAGAIVVGKTNVPVMLGDWQSDNPVYGATSNPWDLSRTAGGSTGGGAAAVAAGMGALTLGTDLSGSIRIPAHFCGVYGHKPSLGIVSAEGLQPGPWDGAPGYPMDVGVIGPLARSADDLRLALSAAGGPAGAAAKAWAWQLPAPRQTRLEDFRIGCVLDDPAAPPTAEVRAVVDAAITAVRKAGGSIHEGWPEGVDMRSGVGTFSYLVGALVTADMDPAERERARGRFAKNPHDPFAGAAVEPHARWLRETQARLAFRARWQDYFRTHDVFLLPTTVTAAFPHDRRQPVESRTIETGAGPRPYVEALPFWTVAASLAGLPATVAPVGFTRGGLPVGLQIVAPMWEDATSIAFAAQLADVIGGYRPPRRGGRSSSGS